MARQDPAGISFCHQRTPVRLSSSRRRHPRFDCDWSSDVCSSDLLNPIDIVPVANGNLRIDEKHGVYLVILDRAEVPETERYVSHFATCPKAGDFRRA